MAQSNRVFVSPGVYTSEKDLSFVNRQIGVTSVGLVGETTKGPAFQPIFISDYDEFKRFFGGLNPKKISDGAGGFYPQYELPYIAKSYLSKSNQLYVTRVLGLSGYDAGLSWSIVIDSNVDTTTSTVDTVTTGATLTYDVSVSGGTVSNISIPVIDTFYNNTTFSFSLSDITSTGDTFNQTTPVYYKINTTDFDGLSFTGTVTSVTVLGDVRTVTVSVNYTTYNALGYADVEGMVVAFLRSRGKYTTNGLDFDIDSSSDLTMVNTGAITDPYGDFLLTGTTQTTGDTFSYNVTMDYRKKNYISKVLGVTEKDGKTSIFVEEIYRNALTQLISENKVRGIKTALVYHTTSFSDYKQEFSPAVTPWVVSELRDNKVLKLFRLITISDGDTANTEIKFSITNINLDSRTFDILIRSFDDTDASPVILERFSKCTMDPTDVNYVARKIGTSDGDFESRSSYVLLELDLDADTTEAFPAGFLGFPTRDYVAPNQAPNVAYKTRYSVLENKRKVYLGLNSTIGIDRDFLQFKGIDNVTTVTNGFHMDAGATTVTIDSTDTVETFVMDVTTANFKTEDDLVGTDYEPLFARKFTFAAYGGFNGWDVYRDSRTNNNAFIVNQFLDEAGYDAAKLELNNLSARPTSEGLQGTNADYYAYLEAIRTFSNPEAVNINVFATPGIDLERNSNLVNETIEMVEVERADSVYVVTMPSKTTEDEAVAVLEDSGIDSNYTATYWPWVQKNDTENNVLINLPTTTDVIRNMAITDNISFPWFSVAGIQRGDVECIKAVKKLTLPNRDVLYEARINPITTWAAEGVKIWGNKTLQIKETALSSLNVRRLLLHTRKLISAVSIRLVFDQNDDVVRNKFLSLVNPILENIRAERGLTDFRVEVDRNPESIDRKELNGRILIKPTPALEFIILEFGITNQGANFDDL